MLSFNGVETAAFSGMEKQRYAGNMPRIFRGYATPFFCFYFFSMIKTYSDPKFYDPPNFYDPNF